MFLGVDSPWQRKRVLECRPLGKWRRTARASRRGTLGRRPGLTCSQTSTPTRPATATRFQSDRHRSRACRLRKNDYSKWIPHSKSIRCKENRGNWAFPAGNWFLGWAKYQNTHNLLLFLRRTPYLLSQFHSPGLLRTKFWLIGQSPI